MGSSDFLETYVNHFPCGHGIRTHHRMRGPPGSPLVILSTSTPSKPHAHAWVTIKSLLQNDPIFKFMVQGFHPCVRGSSPISAESVHPYGFQAGALPATASPRCITATQLSTGVCTPVTVLRLLYHPGSDIDETLTR
jgi:hypothetical protein